jgi:ubiquinone/menaquinone biosynthesis C-methylase UbiE
MTSRFANGNRDRYLKYQKTRKNHWDWVAQKFDGWQGLGTYYHRRLSEIYKFIIPENQRVLELGCGNGQLLASLNPLEGVGIDFSRAMLKQAEFQYPELTFIEADVHEIPLEKTFDYIILSDLLNDLWDVQLVFERLKAFCHPQTRIIINAYSRLWEIPLAAAQKLSLAKPKLQQNWLTVEDVTDLLHLSDFEVIKSWPEIILPVGIPILSGFCNRFLSRLWPFHLLSLTNFIVARPSLVNPRVDQNNIISVIIPARNEAGNIENIFARTPDMGAGTELVFVEGHSQDATYEKIKQVIEQHPERKTQLHKQSGTGKGDAVRLGFAQATGDILMILDADLTVPPEDLPRFYDALISGKGDFINGVRLVYPMEDEAMRFLNLIGNKFFSIAFSWLLGQSIKDTLCGTKVLYKDAYNRIAANRSYFGDFDPFGDFDLIFGAAKQNFKIVDLPIRYQRRSYGSTNINRWKHGQLLLRMVIYAARRIKFV